MASLSAYDRILMAEARALRLEEIIRKQGAAIARLEARVSFMTPPVQRVDTNKIPANPPAPLARMVDIAAEVAAKNMVTVAALRGPDRSRSVAWPRQDAMRRMVDAGFSTPQIGRFLGNRDHTTVMHGARASRLRGEG